MDSQKQFPKAFSFEFFPPKTAAGTEKLRTVGAELATLSPCFFSVTFGAGGSTRDRTLATVHDIHQHTGIDVAPHLSCIGSTEGNILSILETYIEAGVRHLVALRGDMPSGMREAGKFRYADELVTFIREKTGDHFFVEVAAYPEFHPQANNAHQDLEHFCRKVKAGADSALTQYFYNPDAYFRFIHDCEKHGLDIPVVPGIMPITNYTQLARFSDGCGAEIPRWIRRRLEAYGDDIDSIQAFGLDVTTHLCQQLLDGGAPGLHFYTMNRIEPTLSIWENLGIPKDKASRLNLGD